MVDQFAIGLTHGLIAVAVWRLVRDDALDREPGEMPPAPPPPPVRRAGPRRRV